MKTFIKKSLAVLLAIMMLSSTFVCFAVELNQDAVTAHYDQYKNYVLLGDSVASGYRDQITDNDYDYNASYYHTTYHRVPGSYADIIADAIVADGSMKALAAPGFRTIELRYMLEDDFAATYEDEYLFHPSQLYAYDDKTCACHGEVMLPGSTHFREEFKKSIAEADLITLGIGGNDWGAYLTWLIADLFEAENVADEYIAAAKEILDKSTMDIGTVETLVDLAHKAGALPKLLEIVPDALNNALRTFYENWNIMIQDIYDLNPDVTLVVLGMSDNSYKGKYYDYDGVVGEAIPNEEDETKKAAMKFIVGLIMGIGNGPMIEGANKFGYTYVDTDGATYVDSHLDADGHVFVANKVIEALPNREIYNMFKDVKPGYKYYDVIEYVVANGIMTGKTDTEFAPDEIITKGELAAAFNAVNGTDKATDKTDDVTAIHLSFSIIGSAAKKDFLGFFKTLLLGLRVLSDYNANFGAKVSRIEAAQYLMSCNTF